MVNYTFLCPNEWLAKLGYVRVQNFGSVSMWLTIDKNKKLELQLEDMNSMFFNPFPQTAFQNRKWMSFRILSYFLFLSMSSSWVPAEGPNQVSDLSCGAECICKDVVVASSHVETMGSECKGKMELSFSGLCLPSSCQHVFLVFFNKKSSAMLIGVCKGCVKPTVRSRTVTRVNTLKNMTSIFQEKSLPIFAPACQDPNQKRSKVLNMHGQPRLDRF